MKDIIDTSKYIEIPFKNKGREFDGCDCWGLVRLVYKREYDIDLPSFTTSYEDSSEAKVVARSIIENKPLVNYIEKESPEYGDVCVINTKGEPSHVGIYVGRGLLLHVLKGSDSCCERLNGPRLKGRIEGYYEIRKNNQSTII